MTESIKEQEVREELSSEMADKVSGGEVNSISTKLGPGSRHYRDLPPAPEKIPHAVNRPIPSSPSPAEPDDDNEDDTDNIENTNECGTQNIVNQGRDNKARGKIKF